MSSEDRRPLQGTPTTQRISARADNRLGAVYSALHAFWSARHAAVAQAGANGQVAVRRDAYSVLLFDHDVTTIVANDFQRSPDDLLNTALQYEARGGTNYTLALQNTQAVMERNWSSER
jgi:hypothetical protein